MTPDLHALISQMAAELDHCQQLLMDDRRQRHPLADRARTLLAEPEAEGPSDDELWTMYDEMRGEPGDWAWVRDFACAVLARWGHPTPQPVAVSERWPDFSDCDPQERVWAWNPVLDHWKLSRINRSVHTHWLPAHVLPTPEATND